MIELSNTTTQTIEPNASATFNLVIACTGCDTCHRTNSGLVQLVGRSSTSCNKPRYRISVSGNIGGGAGTQANVALALNNETLNETIRTATITADTDVFPFAAQTTITTCSNVGYTVSLKNVGTTPITLSNLSFIAQRTS